MSYKIVILPRAIFDIQVAIEYYDDKRIGLGKKFAATVDSYFTSISKNPFYQVRYSYVRCISLKKFPYLIHFILDEENKTVFIVSLFHSSQDPNKRPD